MRPDTTLCFVRSCSLTWSRSWGPSCASSSCASDWCSRSPRLWKQLSLLPSKLPATPRRSYSSACSYNALLFSSAEREHLISCNQWGTRRWTASDMMVLISTPRLPFEGRLWTNSQSQIRNYVPPTGQMTRPCTIGSTYLEHHEDIASTTQMLDLWDLQEVRICFKTVSWHYIKSCLKNDRRVAYQAVWCDFCFILLRLHR